MTSLKDKLSGLLDAAPDPMVIVDRRGSIVFANSCINSTFGYSGHELVGLPIETLIPERYRNSHARHRHDYFRCPVTRPMGTGLEPNGRRKDGSEFPVEISLGPYESDGETFVWSIIRDSTLHKLLAQEKSFSNSLLDTVPAIILLLDAEGRIIRINPYMEQLCGYLNGEVAGKDWFTSFLPNEHQAQIRDLFGEVVRGGTSLGHVNPIVTRAGALRQIEWYGRTLTDEDGRVTLLNIGHEVTERIGVEEALRRAEKALREADRRKDEFLALLGHELRNPLGAISNALKLASMVSDAEAVLRTRDIVDRQVKQLTRLVDDLLDISRITRGTFRIVRQRVDLNDIVRGAISDVQALVNDAAHSLSVSMPQDPIMIYADSARMTQVLVNLLNNAAKYTPPGGQIGVVVEPTPGGAQVVVNDNGIGIPPDKLETIFEMFAQVNAAGPDSVEGQGIGLSLARAVIEMHGGIISGHSTGVGHGSEFVIWMPTYAAMTSSVDESPMTRTTGASRGEHEPMTRARVLVVDDNRDGAQTLAELVRALGHDAAVAFDGQQAVEAAEASHPQIVLLDLGLPELDGYQVARWIRSQPWADGTQLVALNGWGQESERARTREAGFDRHLTKPISFEMLQELLVSTPTADRFA